MAWSIITDFGDSAAMLPVAALLFVWLAGNGRLRAAGLWGGLFAAQALLVAATKIAFRGWGIGIESVDFTGISGHSTLACSVVPIACYLTTQRAGRVVRTLAAAAGGAAALLIAISRIALAQHSWSEVIAGCLLGGGVATVFIALSDGPAQAARLSAPMVAGAIALVAVMIHGTRAPTEVIITKIALHLSGHSTPWRRDPWRHRIVAPYPDDAELGSAADEPSASRLEASRHIGCVILTFHDRPRCDL